MGHTPFNVLLNLVSGVQKTVQLHVKRMKLEPLLKPHTKIISDKRPKYKAGNHKTPRKNKQYIL